MTDKKDKKGYYKELGIEKTATTEEIKQSYRKLALKWHPDKNPDNVHEATRVFQKISESYSVLVDPKKREQYDRFGSVEDYEFDYDDFVGHFDFDGLFNMMFGGMELFANLGAMGAMGGMGGNHGHSKRKGAGHGKMGASAKRAQAQMAKMFDGFGMGGMGMGGMKESKKKQEKAKAEEGWETEEEYSDDEDEKKTETPGQPDKKTPTAANDEKGAKEEESKKKDVEDRDEDYEDCDDDGDYDDFDDGLDDYDNMDEETERRINKEMYGEEDEEDFKNFDDFMGKAENMFFLPMFAAENSKDVDKKRTKCNLCKQVMPNDDIFEHMSKSHKKQLDAYIDKAANEDYARDEKRMKNDPFSMLAGAMGGKGMAGMGAMFDIMGGLDAGAGSKSKNKKKK